MTRVLRRLRHTNVDELGFRCREGGFVAAEALLIATGRGGWRRTALRPRLLPASRDLEQARAALKQRAWRDAAALLRQHFVRRQPLFVLDPSTRDTIASRALAQFPDCRYDAVRRADRVLAGRYDLLGYEGLSFGHGGQIDWHFDPVHGRRAAAKFWTRVPYLDPASGDHKIIWELNRHQHWLALGRAAWLAGDERYAVAFARELESWIQANPPLRGINWASMLELAFRSISWIWALHFFAAFDDVDPAWTIDLLLGLDRQLAHIARHLSSYFSPNTHLLGEGLALYVAGRVLPEFTSAASWSRIGREILVHEAHAQVHADGGHAELSTHYHRYALDFYLLALAVARRTQDPAAGAFEETAQRLATYCRAMAGDDGRLPNLGDDDGGLLFPICGRSPSDARDSLSLAAALLERPRLAVGAPPEEVFWMQGGHPAPADASAPGAATPAVQCFPDTGYAVIRNGNDHAILDVGRHGFLNGGHAHADALSLVLSVGGRPLFIDPGTATYTVDQTLRDRFRSTEMHNTLTLDGTAQSVPRGPFHWKSRTDARLLLHRTAGRLDYVEGQHEGYAPVEHRRAVLCLGEGLWIVADHVLGTTPHRAQVYWHVDPSWTVHTSEGQAVRLAHVDGACAALATTASEQQVFHGDAAGLGWWAPVYGKLLPAPTLRFETRQTAPFSIFTVIASGNVPVPIAVEPVVVLADRGHEWHCAGISVKYGEADLLALFATPVAPTPAGPRKRVLCADGELMTDARVAVLRRQGAEPTSLDLIEGTCGVWTTERSFGAGPNPAPPDRHLDLAPVAGSLVSS